MTTTNSIRRVDYYHATVKDEPGVAYQILNQLAEMGLNLQALTVIPVGLHTTQMTLFPEDGQSFAGLAKQIGLTIQGPFQAILVQGNDKIGALSEIHKVLFLANVNVYASSGVSDGKGSFGYVVYVRPEAFGRAAEALGI